MVGASGLNGPEEELHTPVAADDLYASKLTVPATSIWPFRPSADLDVDVDACDDDDDGRDTDIMGALKLTLMSILKITLKLRQQRIDNPTTTTPPSPSPPMASALVPASAIFLFCYPPSSTCYGPSSQSLTALS